MCLQRVNYSMLLTCLDFTWLKTSGNWNETLTKPWAKNTSSHQLKVLITPPMQSKQSRAWKPHEMSHVFMPASHKQTWCGHVAFFSQWHSSLKSFPLWHRKQLLKSYRRHFISTWPWAGRITSFSFKNRLFMMMCYGSGCLPQFWLPSLWHLLGV